MTAAEPVPDAPVAALWCSDRAPLADLALCRRLAGHSGMHQSDGGDDWADLPTPTEENDRDHEH